MRSGSTSSWSAFCAGVEVSVASTVKFDVPAGPLGVPVIAPVDGSSVSPVGSDPVLIDHV